MSRFYLSEPDLNFRHCRYLMMKLKRIFFILFLMVMVSDNIYAQVEEIQQPSGRLFSIKNIDETVSGLMDSGQVTGLCLGILNDNRPAYVKAYGYRDKTNLLPNDTATCFYAASLAKPLFAYIVMELQILTGIKNWKYFLLPGNVMPIPGKVWYYCRWLLNPLPVSL